MRTGNRMSGDWALFMYKSGGQGTHAMPTELTLHAMGLCVLSGTTVQVRPE